MNRHGEIHHGDLLFTYVVGPLISSVSSSVLMCLLFRLSRNNRHNHRRISFPEQIIHEHLALLHDSDEKIQPHKCHLQF